MAEQDSWLPVDLLLATGESNSVGLGFFVIFNTRLLKTFLYAFGHLMIKILNERLSGAKGFNSIPGSGRLLPAYSFYPSAKLKPKRRWRLYFPVFFQASKDQTTRSISWNVFIFKKTLQWFFKEMFSKVSVSNAKTEWRRVSCKLDDDRCLESSWAWMSVMMVMVSVMVWRAAWTAWAATVSAVADSWPRHRVSAEAAETAWNSHAHLWSIL